MVPTLERLIGLIGRVLHIVGIGALPIMVIVIVLDVAGRYFFSAPLKGAYDSVEYLLVVVAFCGLAYVGAQKGHIAMELFISRLRPRQQAVLASLTLFPALIVLCLMIYGAIQEGVRSWQHGILSPQISIPIFPFRFVVALGFLALLLQLSTDFLHALSQARKGACSLDSEHNTNREDIKKGGVGSV